MDHSKEVYVNPINISVYFGLINILLVTISFVLNLIVIAALSKHKEMQIKRYYFIVNICTCHIIFHISEYLYHILTFCSNVHFLAFVFLIDIKYYMLIIKSTLIICFLTDTIYDRLIYKQTLTNLLILCWFLLPIISLLISAICWWTGMNYLFAFGQTPLYNIYFTYGLLLLILIIKCFPFLFKREKSTDYKIRFLFCSLLIVVIIFILLIDFLFIYTFLSDIYGNMLHGIQMVIVLALLLNLDANFKYVVKVLIGTWNISNRHLPREYNSLEQLR